MRWVAAATVLVGILVDDGAASARPRRRLVAPDVIPSTYRAPPLFPDPAAGESAAQARAFQDATTALRAGIAGLQTPLACDLQGQLVGALSARGAFREAVFEMEELANTRS